MNDTFKVGDIVRCVSGSIGIEVGKLYTITKFRNSLNTKDIDKPSSDSDLIFVKESSAADGRGYWNKRFEAVRDVTDSVVKVVSNVSDNDWGV